MSSNYILISLGLVTVGWVRLCVALQRWAWSGLELMASNYKFVFGMTRYGKLRLGQVRPG